LSLVVVVAPEAPAEAVALVVYALLQPLLVAVEVLKLLLALIPQEITPSRLALAVLQELAPPVPQMGQTLYLLQLHPLVAVAVALVNTQAGHN
jgi:hypothetical protein